MSHTGSHHHHSPHTPSHRHSLTYPLRHPGSPRTPSSGNTGSRIQGGGNLNSGKPSTEGVGRTEGRREEGRRTRKAQGKVATETPSLVRGCQHQPDPREDKLHKGMGGWADNSPDSEAQRESERGNFLRATGSVQLLESKLSPKLGVRRPQKAGSRTCCELQD